MKKFFVTMSVLGLFSLLISCGDIADSSADKTAPNGKARVSFSLGQIANRVIDPLNITAEDISHLELTAQKLSDEDKYESYKFGESESLSWESISIMEKASVTLDFGTYNFTLKLYTLKEDGKTEFVVQTAKLEAQTVDSSTKTLEFNAKYKDSGDVKISVSWNLLEDLSDPCRINKIESAFYTLDSFGKDLADGIEKQAFEISTNDETDEKIASASYTEVPNGSYIIKLFLYNSETATEPFDTITDIIKVNGYKTLYDLKLDPDELNVQYEAVFDPNGGTWEDNSTGPKTVLRNAYSGFIPPEEEVTNDELGLVGWYTFPNDRIPENPEEQGISGGTSYERIAREDYAQDYKFFAIWGKKTGGKLIKDNRALIIKTDIVDGKIYQNSKINLSVTDSNGKTVTDAIKYDAKILYKGKDINERTVDGCPYYQAEGKEIFLRGLGNPLPKAKYQLYVTASRELSSSGASVTSSQTFDVELADGLATPETQVALYNYDSGSYKYYLTNSDDVGAELGTADFTSSKDNFVFDAAGNIYNLNDDKELVSNNELITNQPLSMSSDLSGSSGASVKEYGFTVDLATNIAYGYVLEQVYNSGSYTYNLNVYKYPKLISDGSLEQKTSMNKNDITLKSGYKVSINNNLLYLYGTADYTNYKVIVYDISSGSMVQFSEFNVTEYLTASERGLASTTESGNISVNDIFATEGALYLLVQEKVDVKSTSKDIYRRGSVIKYIPPETSNGTGTTPIFLDLKTTPAISKTAISNMALYYDSATNGNASGPLYAVAGTDNDSPSGMEDVVTIENVGKTLAFPDIYGVNETEKYLSAPAKVIAVKPKKLVIADDGCAFYTDSECLKYKNMNRIVTVDLEDFVVESVQTTTAEFSSNISSYLKTDIAITNLEETKTSQEDGYYFESSVKQWEPATIEGIKEQLYLAVKPGE